MIKLKENSAAAEAHFIKIEKPLKQRIKNVLKNGIKKDGNPIAPDTILRGYLKHLLTGDNLKQLILLKPESIHSTIASMKKYFPDFFNSASDSSKILYNIFVASCYDKTDVFSKHDFISDINIDTCPYCNRNYIYYLSKKNSIKPQIDHFYPKTKYPFLAMTFYNLIPSCQTCNGLEVKGELDPVRKGLINPYLIENDQFLFSYKPTSSGILGSLLDKHSVEVYLKAPQGNIDVFKLQELYNLHTDHVVELVIKSKIKYSTTYRDYLEKYKEHGLVFSENEIDRMILGNYTNVDEIHKRPFSKLYVDIGLDLGLIK